MLDHPQLPRAQGVTAGSGLGAKVLTDGRRQAAFISHRPTQTMAQGTQGRTYPGRGQDRQTGFLGLSGLKGQLERGRLI
ncbi:hypothetical protein D3C85_1574010 [compost metagenome]